MAWVGTGIVVGGMASVALGWCPGKPCCMAFEAIGRLVRPCEGEVGRVVIEYNIGVTGRVTSQTRIAVVNVSSYANVLVVGFWVGMASCTSKLGIIGWIGVAIGASCPLPIVFSTINREILNIMVKCGRGPHRLCVTACAVGRKPERDVVGGSCLAIIVVMATVAGVGGIVVVAVVALYTVVGNGRVRSV